VDGLLRDPRFTVRNMWRSPRLAAVIATSLALGIGAITAIFSLIEAMMMKSLPVQDPEQLRLMHWFGETWPRGLQQSGSGGPNNPAYKAASRSQAYPFFREVRRRWRVWALRHDLLRRQPTAQRDCRAHGARRALLTSVVDDPASGGRAGVRRVAAGIPLSMWASKYVSTLLFGLTPRDPVMLT
jgi:hypothetical protein